MFQTYYIIKIINNSKIPVSNIWWKYIFLPSNPLKEEPHGVRMQLAENILTIYSFLLLKTSSVILNCWCSVIPPAFCTTIQANISDVVSPWKYLVVLSRHDDSTVVSLVTKTQPTHFWSRCQHSLPQSQDTTWLTCHILPEPNAALTPAAEGAKCHGIGMRWSGFSKSSLHFAHAHTHTYPHAQVCAVHTCWHTHLLARGFCILFIPPPLTHNKLSRSPPSLLKMAGITVLGSHCGKGY